MSLSSSKINSDIVSGLWYFNTEILFNISQLTYRKITRVRRKTMSIQEDVWPVFEEKLARPSILRVDNTKVEFKNRSKWVS